MRNALMFIFITGMFCSFAVGANAEDANGFAEFFAGQFNSGGNSGTLNSMVFYGLIVLVAMLCFSVFLLFSNYKKAKYSNTLLKTFINADNRLIYLKDENLRYIFVNTATENFYGKDASEIIGFDDYALSEKEFAEERIRTDREVLDKNAHVFSEVAWNNRIYETNKFPIRLSNGKIGVGAYIEDITEARRQKKEEEKTLLRKLILVDVFSRDFSSSKERLEYALEKALQLTESSIGYIYHYNEKTREFTLNTWSENVMAECTVAGKQKKCRLEKAGLWGEAVRQRKPVVINDFQMPNAVKNGYPEGHIKIKRFMSIPVIIENEIFSVIGLANKESDYDDNDVYQVTVLMTGVWNAKVRQERRLELEKANIELQENKDKLQLILDSAAEGIYGIDKNGICTFCNTRCVEMLGYNDYTELIGKNMHEMTHHRNKNGSLIPADRCKIYQTLITGEGTHAEDEVFYRADGTMFDVEYFSYPQFQNGELVGAVVTFMDITERKKSEEDIKYLSYHDSLTGLYNRMFFEEELKRLNTKRNLPLSIIMGDVNGLKLTNDVFGHTFGDMLLKKAAETLRTQCRADDIISRIGGDEFVILLPKTEKEEAESIMKRIQDAFSKEKIAALRGSMAMGCDTKFLMDQDIIHVLKNAENKMYMQKTLNRSSIDEEFINTIMETLYARSPKEKEHSEIVSEMCVATGKEIGLSDSELRKLKEAGRFHDIGKIILDDGLLNKNIPLSPKEKKEMRMHCLTGFRILNSFEGTVDLAESILAHHERWDGSGYPKGLKGVEIPLLARIIAVAEAYDAMTGKKGKTPEEAVHDLKELAGSKFDPEVVSAFIKAIL